MILARMALLSGPNREIFFSIATETETMISLRVNLLFPGKNNKVKKMKCFHAGYNIMTIFSVGFFLVAFQTAYGSDILPLDSITELTQLTTHLSDDSDSIISPEGKRLAFISKKRKNKDIFVAGILVKNPCQVTIHSGEDSNPSWTPDRKHLLFDSDRLGYRAIFKIDLNREKIIHQVVARGSDDYAPDVSPDGKKITFGNKAKGKE